MKSVDYPQLADAMSVILTSKTSTRHVDADLFARIQQATGGTADSGEMFGVWAGYTFVVYVKK